MRELFVEKVINTVEDFLDNNPRIKLKEILTEISPDRPYQASVQKYV